jgi:Tol biopolymer transport system component
VTPKLGEFQAAEVVAGLDTSGDLWGPSLSADGLTLVFGAGSPETIFAATRAERGGPFKAGTALAGVNRAGSEGTPFLSADGLSLYLYSMAETEGGAGERNLERATRAKVADNFGAPAPLATLNTPADEQNPWVSADELRIVFDSNRPGGEGGADLWLARRPARTGDFEAPQNLDELNSSGSEEGATLSADELNIFFASSRTGGQGSLDIWFATRGDTTSDFSTPLNLQVVNSSGLDLDPALGADGSELFFSSSRSGTQQLYRSVRSCN